MMNFITSSSSFLPRLPCSRTSSITIIHLQPQLQTSKRLLQSTSVKTRRLQCYCSSSTSSSTSASNRRKHIGVPKNVELEPLRQLRPDETQWEDYLIPTLEGNSHPKDPSRYMSPVTNPFIVLGIETSCDDTAAALVTSDGRILSEFKISQTEQTEEWGGVVPHIARDLHENAIEKVIDETIKRSDITEDQIDAVAATMGPGLEVCLRVGYRAARKLSRRLNNDFVAINHLEAHLLVSRLTNNNDQIQFPFLTLLLSGGHCQLLVVYNISKYEILGGTLDDALGEAYDKVARLLGLPIGNGGGPQLEKLAMSGNPNAIPFPVPMQKRSDCNFSFAGLKTCVRLAIEKLGGTETVQGDQQIAADIAASFQQTAILHLEQNLKRAIKICSDLNVRTLVLSGGVASNKAIRTRISDLCLENEWDFVVPPVKLCTDNGVMVAWTGIERLKVGIADDFTSLDVRARWPLASYNPQLVSKSKTK